MKYIDLSFIKPDKDCEVCDQEYVCFECEHTSKRKISKSKMGSSRLGYKISRT